MRNLPSGRIRLRLIHLIHLKLEGCEPELANIKHILPNSKRIAIDIGANIGHYSIELSKYFEHVHAFEINDELTKDLTRTYRNVSVKNVGLSSKRGKAVLYIPLLNGQLPLLGWASLTPGNCPDTDIHLEKDVEITTLDSFNIQKVDFIKIDVEGHELEVLLGARQTLEKNSPTLLIEIKQQNTATTIDFLEKLGYNLCPKPPCIQDLPNENFIFKRAVQR